MKPEEQRIAIAEACGLKEYQSPAGAYWYGEDHPSCQDGATLWELPDYLNDLNAMHEAEKILTPKQRDAYFWELLKTTPSYDLMVDGLDGNNGGFEFISMTAPQRAEAFLHTLNLYTP